jgi:3-hydroxyisobutyrate dehydrogenase-like beta-hydroxyacid dehydrogenase
MAEVTFAGLGSMGSGMARRLLGAGHTVHVWNRSRGPVDELVGDGAIAVDRPEDVLKTGLTFSMLANDAAVTSVFTREAMAAAPTGAVHVNMATIGLDTADALAALHAEFGVGYLAAPVLGRPDVAAAGNLNIVVSGDAAGIAAVQPYLDVLGKHTWNVGTEARTANLVKLAVNFNIIHAIQALAESITLVEAGGVDPSTFVEIITDVAFTGSVYKGYGKLISEHSYVPGFTVTLGSKDLGLVAKAANDHGLTLPSVAALQQVYAATLADPALAELDWSATAEVTRQQHDLRGSSTA